MAAVSLSALGMGLWPWVHPLSWDAPTVAFALAAALAARRGRAVLPKAAPQGLEVLLAVVAATLLSARLGYDGGVVGAPPAAAAGGPGPDWLPFPLVDPR